MAVGHGQDRRDIAWTRARSRRATLRSGGALLAATGAFAYVRSAGAQATPTAATGALLLVQSFSQGNLFPTQGDVGVLPYTVILWDAAERGFFVSDPASGTAGVRSTDTVISAIGAGEQPRAVLVAPVAEESGAAASQEVWALRLGYGGLGSDPGAVTYQGEPLPAEDAAAWLETAPATLPDGPRDLGPGFIIISGLSGFDASASDGVTLRLR